MKNDEKEVRGALGCSCCGKKRASVHERPNGYANNVGNDPDATHTVCDWCDYQNCMDI